MRAASTSSRLTLEDAVAIWHMRQKGMCQHDIAATFRVNPGRVNEVLKGKRFPESERIARNSG